MKRSFLIVVAAGTLALAGALESACSSNTEEATPTRPPVPIVTPDSDAGDAAVEAAPVDPGCVGPAGCFKCAPAKNDEFLNACTDGQCTPFDNTARLPLFKAGQPLTAVP
jgi:hypothetical protein